MVGNGTLSLSGLSVVHADGGNLQIRLSVSHGTLSVQSWAPVTINGNNTATLTLTGTLANVTGTLASYGLTYTPTAAYEGADSLAVHADDQGNTGSGGALTDDESVAITVTTPPTPTITSTPTPVPSAIAGNIAAAGNGVAFTVFPANTPPLST